MVRGNLSQTKPRLTNVCKLCGRNATLVLSHIIPHFVVKWLKKTSATGYFRNLDSGKRQQESKRVHLLCSNCEQLLGRDEKRFAERIFSPYHHRPQPKSFEYDEWLLRFIVGLHWRGLVTSEPVPENVRSIFAAAEERWREFLLGKVADPGASEFHVQFVDVIEHTTFNIPKKMNWYLARSFDASPIYTASSGAALFYVKLGRIITLSFISARNSKEEDWKGTQVAARGTINVKQDVSTTRFGEFLLERGRAIDDAPRTLTARQKKKLQEQAETNPQVILNSDSFQVHLADRNMSIGPRDAVYVDVRGRDRNKPCLCGSGLKAKKCCGKP